MRYALILLLLYGTAHAAGAWERIDMPGGVGYWEIDRASITPTKDGTQKMLARLTYSGVQTDAEGNAWDHSVLITETDCAKRLWRVLDVATYLRAERIIPRRTSSDWTPGSEKSVIIRAVCR